MNTIGKTFTTSEIAKRMGVHPNTVRLYEDLLLIPKADRKENGYRVFTDLHLDQFQLARTALQIEVMQNGLRKKILKAVKKAALRHFDAALCLTQEYILSVEKEIRYAHEALAITQELLQGLRVENTDTYKRNEVSKMLDISMDMLRNWEMNGLLCTKKKENGYRIYTHVDLQKLKIIRTLRCANYSLTAILRMMTALSKNENVDIIKLLNTPEETEEIQYVCDKLLLSLQAAKGNAQKMLVMLTNMKTKYSNPPL